MSKLPPNGMQMAMDTIYPSEMIHGLVPKGLAELSSPVEVMKPMGGAYLKA